MRTFTLPASDGVALQVNQWSADQPPRAALLLIHGMSEHGARYAELGQALAARGIALYAPDLRGHGVTGQRQGLLGHYADHDGWRRVLEDLHQLELHLRACHPQVPLLLFGHSMGSYLAQAYLLRHGAGFAGAVLSGSNYQSPALYRLGRLVARLERWRQGPHGRSALLEWLTFGAFNKAFRPNRTRHDWLSRDPASVDAYLADPLCGFRCTNQLWIDLFGGLLEITPVANLAQIPHDLPLLVIGGERDPVSDGRRQLDLVDALRRAGLERVSAQLYPDARHELLHETNRADVIAFLLDWLEAALANRQSCHPKEIA
ncbi:alpha/beta hydrolase [Pseudomonas sp. RL]|uniref:alpha/beta hydrolase n=1 Tax=Pseudomonas sp. RL TaxID=1452718 RepID=UPI000484D1AE|nr:alpha/beta hydrolase [Pseudomonas sp. RL]